MTEPLAQELYEQLAPWAYEDPQTGYPLRKVCEALTLPAEAIDAVGRDSDDGPGWSALVDIERAPDWALPWLAQAVGARLPQGSTAAEQRERIRSAAGFSRGTPAAMTAAAQAHLTGNKVVRLLERDTSPYHLTVITRTAETPDSAVVRAALMEQKPAGLVLDYSVSDAPIINEGTRTIDAAASTINTATLADIT